MKIIIIKSTGKIILGKFHFKCPFLVKILLSFNNFSNKLTKKGRTYWIRANFKSNSIMLGDEKINLTSNQFISMGENISYLIQEQNTPETYVQYISHSLNQITTLKTPLLIDNEEIAVIYTSIDNCYQNRLEITHQLLKEMKSYLAKYPFQIYNYYDTDKHTTNLLTHRIEQVKRMSECIDNWLNKSKDIYKQCNGKDYYIVIEL